MRESAQPLNAATIELKNVFPERNPCGSQALQPSPCARRHSPAIPMSCQLAHGRFASSRLHLECRLPAAPNRRRIVIGLQHHAHVLDAQLLHLFRNAVCFSALQQLARNDWRLPTHTRRLLAVEHDVGWRIWALRHLVVERTASPEATRSSRTPSPPGHPPPPSSALRPNVLVRLQVQRFRRGRKVLRPSLLHPRSSTAPCTLAFSSTSSCSPQGTARGPPCSWTRRPAAPTSWKRHPVTLFCSGIGSTRTFSKIIFVAFSFCLYFL